MYHPIILLQRSSAGMKRSWGAPATPLCPACGRAVYPTEQVFAADRKPFHKACIQCRGKGCRSGFKLRCTALKT